MDEDERMRTIVVQSSNNDTEPSHLDIFLRLYWFIGKVDTEQKVIALKKEYKLEDACKYLREQKFLDHFMLIDKSKHNRIVHFQEKISGERLEAEKKLLQSMRLCSVEEFIDTIFVDRELVRNIDKLLELFDKISASRLFCDFPELQSHHHPSIPKAMEGTQTTTHSSIIWFDFNENQTIGSVLLGFLEYSIMLKFLKCQRKDQFPQSDLQLPWRFAREMPSQLKEYPEAVKEGQLILIANAEQKLAWLGEEERGDFPKNPSRERFLFRMCYKARQDNNLTRLKDQESLLSELLSLFNLPSREKLLDQIYNSPLESFGDVSDFLLKSIGHSWVDSISNLRIRRFQEIEEKKEKKKKKQKKTKKRDAEIASDPLAEIDQLEETTEPRDTSNEKSGLNDKTNGDDDTKCANTTHLSQELKEHVVIHHESQSESNCPLLREELYTDSAQQEQTATKNLIKKKTNKKTKEDHKREKRRLKKQKQKTEAARLKKLTIAEISSDSISGYSPLEKASCLSVAGSGVMAVSEDHFLRKAKAQTSCNLILKHKQSFFDDEVVVEARDRCLSLCSADPDLSHQEDRCLSSDTKRKTQNQLLSNHAPPKDSLADKAVTPRLHQLTLKPRKSLKQSKEQGHILDQHTLVAVVGRKKSNSVKPVEGDVCVFGSSKVHGSYSKVDSGDPRGSKKQQSSYAATSKHTDRSSAADFKTHYKRVAKQPQVHTMSSHQIVPTPEQLDINSRYKRRPANSTASDKNNYKMRVKPERLERRYEEPSLSTNGYSTDELSMGKNQFASAPAMMADQLILTESLGLAQLLDNGNLPIDDNFYIRQFSMPMPFMCPIKQEESVEVEVVSDEEIAKPSIVALEAEARCFVDEMVNYSQSIEKVRLICKERVELVARETFMGTAELHIKTYGSWDTGLSIPSSDIDLLVSTPGVDKELSVKMLEVLEENMKDFAWASAIRNIPSAQIPVLKLKVDSSIEFTRQGFPEQSISEEILSRTNELVTSNSAAANSTNLPSARSTPIVTPPVTQLSIDIIVETPEISALHTTLYVKNSIARWPELQALVLLLKYFLSRKGLTNPYTGGLSSYAISLLVEAWLERQKSIKDYKGHLYLMFRDLVEFYGVRFDHTTHQFGFQHLSTCRIYSSRRTGSWPFVDSVCSILSITDPVSTFGYKNVTYNAFSFPNIKKELRALWEELKRTETLDISRIRTPNSSGDSFFLRLFNLGTNCSTDAD